MTNKSSPRSFIAQQMSPQVPSNRLSSPSNSPINSPPPLSPVEVTKPKSLFAGSPSEKKSLSIRGNNSPIPSLSPKTQSLLASSLKKKEVSETAESILMSYGYFPLAKFFNTSEDDTVASYIKCLNRYGETVYVDMDDIDFVSQDDSSLFVSEGPLKEVPLAIKVGDLDCVDDIVCGLAYDCQDGFCVVKGSDKEKTSSYVYTEEVKSRSLSGPDGIAHPVISMLEIKKDPESTLKMTHKAVERIRRKAEEDSRQRIEESKKAVQQFMTAYSTFTNYVQALEQGYGKTIETLQNYSDGNYAIMLSKDKDSSEYREAMKKQRMISNEIHIRGKKLQEMIVVSRELSQRLALMNNNTAYLTEQTKKLQELTEKINTTFTSTEEIRTKESV